MGLIRHQLTEQKFRAVTTRHGGTKILGHQITMSQTLF